MGLQRGPRVFLRVYRSPSRPAGPLVVPPPRTNKNKKAALIFFLFQTPPVLEPGFPRFNGANTCLRARWWRPRGAKARSMGPQGKFCSGNSPRRPPPDASPSWFSDLSPRTLGGCISPPCPCGNTVRPPPVARPRAPPRTEAVPNGGGGPLPAHPRPETTGFGAQTVPR